LSATVAGLLAQARAAGVDRLDAHLLLARLLDQPRTWLIAHDDAAVPAAQAARFLQQTAERARGVPLAYLLGEREFHGLLLRVTPDVLVPRPDTVADLGTGSGAIALALKQAHGAAQVCAVERSPAALAVAHANGERLGLPVEWLQGDWFSPLTGRRFDLIVSNPPYIDGTDAHLAALHAEPLAALTPGPDGLADLRVLARNAPHHLQPGGWLLLEHGHDQGAAVRALLQEAGLALVQTRRDLGGQERCTAGRRDPA
jgi:release factor glutamine methyltransferase